MRLLLAVLLLSACSHMKPVPSEIEDASARGKVRYIVRKDGDFYKPPGQANAMSFNMVNAFAAAYGAEFIKPIENSDAFIVEAAKKPEAPRGWKVEQEYIYHTHQVGDTFRLIPFKCGEGTPPPAPPGNTPGPISNLTWGQKTVRASEASAILPKTDVKICDIDTGLDSAVHGEFPAGTIEEGFSAIPGENWDQDKGSGHGTHTAGTIASTKYGVTRATALYICKGLSSRDGSGSSSSLAGCINKCRAWGARVINASWGMDQGSDSTIGAAVDAFVQSGGVFVASAGNSSGRQIGFPASKANVIAVTSLDQSGRLSYFSSKGLKTSGDMVIAPGSDIPSLPNGKTMSGTSMSAPHVTAIVALALQKGLRAPKVVNKNLPANEQGRGLADALETVK